jgi:predicted ester cyclase
MSADANHAVGRRFFAEQDRLRGGPAADLCAPSYTAHIAGNPPIDLAGHQAFARAFYAAFPDMSHTVDDTVADDERVAVRFTLRGTQTGDFMGIPATGRPVELGAMAILHVAGGRVTSLRAGFDQLGMLRQLGVLPDAA